MHIWTDTPLEEIWNQLRYLTSQANVINLLTKKIASGRKTPWPLSEQLENQANEIVSCIRQADEYFQASRAVGLATKPLLQFYGAQALSKAVILANEPSISLAHLNYHGLSTRASTAQTEHAESLREYAASPSVWQLELEYAVTNDGVFPHLAAVAQDVVPSLGNILRLKELFRIIPDISNLYRRHYNEPSHCIYLYGDPEIDKNGHFNIFFSERNRDEVLQVFPEFSSGYEPVEKHSHVGFRSIASLSEKPSFGYMEKGTVAGNYYVRPHHFGIHKSMTVLYASMFILSTVVRYKPAFWLDNLTGKKSGSSSLAEAVTILFARRFPNDVLEHIWHERFTYGAPGYLT